MERHGDSVELSVKEASNRTSPQGVRWVLAVSLVLALVAMTFVWVIPAAT